jgi:hypothetical protein
MYNKLEGRIEPTYSDLESGALDMRPPSWKYAPPWANYVAQNNNGRWNWFENKPISNPSTGKWVSIRTADGYTPRTRPVDPTNVSKWMSNIQSKASGTNL